MDNKVPDLVLQFEANHPCGAGHFPGNPIIPGALLLHEVLSRIASALALNNPSWQIKSAKFPQSVRPGDTVHITYTQAVSGAIRFSCTVSDGKVLSGVALPQPVEESP